MKKTIIGTLFLAYAACMGGEPLAIYAETAWPEAKRPALREALLREWTENGAALEKIISSLQQEKLSDRVLKRLEIATRLTQSTENMLKEDSISSLLLGRRMVRDMKVFLAYFEEEDAFFRQAAKQPEPVIFSIADFGAEGNGKTNDSDAFEKAAVQLRELAGRPAVLKLPAGRYLLNTPFASVPFNHLFAADGKCVNDRKGHWNLTGLKNITIEGEAGNTEIIFGDFDTSGIFLLGSERTILRNLKLRYREKTFAQGTILEVSPENKSIRFMPDKGFLLPDDPKFRNGKGPICCQSYDGGKRIVREASTVFWNREFTRNADGSYTLPISRGFRPGLIAGLKFIIPCRDDAISGLCVSGSKFCTLEDIEINSTRAGAFTVALSAAINLLRCRILPEPDAVFSTNADGIHCDNNEFGVYVKDCEFKNMGDDAFNVYGRGYYLSRSDHAGILMVMRHRAGNLLSIVNPTTGQVKAELTVTGNSIGTWDGKEIPLTQFSKEEILPADIVTYETLEKEAPSAEEIRDMRLGAARVKALPDLGFDFSRSGMGSVLIGNHFFGNRNNAIVIQAPNALLENNVLENFTYYAIRIGAFTTWNEGPPPYNVTVRNNFIADARTGIYTDYTVKNEKRSRCRAIRDLLFSGNQISRCGQAFFFENANGIEFENNRMTASGNGHIRNSANVRGKANTADGRPLAKTGYSLDQCENDSINLADP